VTADRIQTEDEGGGKGTNLVPWWEGLKAGAANYASNAGTFLGGVAKGVAIGAAATVVVGGAAVGLVAVGVPAAVVAGAGLVVAGAGAVAVGVSAYGVATGNDPISGQELSPEERLSTAGVMIGSVGGYRAAARIGSAVSGLLPGARPAAPTAVEAQAEVAGLAAEEESEALIGSVQESPSPVEAPNAVSISDRNLQKVFGKHGSDFGLTGNWNPSRAAEVRSAILNHLNSPGVQRISGTYRGMKVTHVVDPTTGLNVILDEAGNFVGGWKLGAEQLASVLQSGRLF
jgi:hypothetical protein